MRASWTGGAQDAASAVLDRPPLPRPVAPERPVAEDRYRLLLVEDSDPDARLFEAALEDSGLDAELRRVRDLSAALEAVEAEPWDLMLLDLGLPATRGLRTVERAAPALTRVPTVVLTGLDDEEVALESLRRGVEEYLVKDELTPRALSRTVRYVVARDRYRRQAREQRALRRGVLRSLSEHIAVLDAEGRIVETNPAWAAFARSQGGRRDGYLGASYLDVTRRAAPSEESAREMVWGLEQVLAGARDAFTLEYPCHGPGERRWFRATVTPMFGTEGGAVVSHANVTERRLAEEELRASEERYAATFEMAPLGIVVSDGASNEFLAVNRAFEEMSGWREEELLGRSSIEIGLWENPAQRAAIMESVRTEGAASGVEGVLVTAAGGRCDVRVSCRAIGVDDLVAWTIEDVTEHVQRQAALEASEDRYRTLFEASLDPISITHRDGRVLEVNEAWCELTGYGSERTGALDVGELYVDPGDRARMYRLLDEQGGFRDYECELRRSDGNVRVVRVTGTALRSEDGEVTSAQAIIRDVTERKRLEEELERRALHDWLTGLPNRGTFADRVEGALLRAREEGSPLAVVLLDLDRFRQVNESLGPSAGDRILTEAARRLEGVVRSEGTAARLGSDEFALLLTDRSSRVEVERLVARVRRVLREPFVVAGDEVQVSASAGVVVYGDAFGSGGLEVDGHEDLLRFAELALRRAKTESFDGAHLFDPAADMEGAARLQREQELRRAIERDEFVLHYQPIVRLATGDVVAVEPLARWRHPERGLLGPGAFIPLAEETGLVHELGTLLLSKACRWLGRTRVRRTDGSPLVITPNLSGRQFEDPELTARVAAILEETGVTPEQIHFEVTETAIARAMDQVDRLKEIGVHLAVDDFGTGYSSLTYVRELDVDGIKIDMSFVQGMTEDPRDAAIVQAIITLGKALELEILAEGIETEAQRRAVTELGCDYGQGYHLHRPMPAEELEQLMG